MKLALSFTLVLLLMPSASLLYGASTHRGTGTVHPRMTSEGLYKTWVGYLLCCVMRCDLVGLVGQCDCFPMIDSAKREMHFGSVCVFEILTDSFLIDGTFWEVLYLTNIWRENSVLILGHYRNLAIVYNCRFWLN